jgi:DNA-binding NarL/FixJ family response regulator
MCLDLATIGITMPHAYGIDAFIEEKHWRAQTRTLVLVGTSANSLLAVLTDAVVDGSVLKSGQPEELQAGIRKLANGARAARGACHS